MTSTIAGLDVSRETLERLAAFQALLLKWTKRINLISAASQADFHERHIVDCAQLFALVPQPVGHWVDLGSGGGLPGIVIGCLMAQTQKDHRLTLVESDLRKATFLRKAISDLGLAGTVIANRAESVPPLAADVLSARALAPLDALLGLAQPHMAPDAVALFPKGARHQQEIDTARRNWHFDMTLHPSLTDDAAQILAIRGIQRASA